MRSCCFPLRAQEETIEQQTVLINTVFSLYKEKKAWTRPDVFKVEQAESPGGERCRSHLDARDQSDVNISRRRAAGDSYNTSFSFFFLMNITTPLRLLTDVSWTKQM